MARIACRQLTKKYGNVTAVDRLDLEIRDTEFMVLLGPSGCGKTTTLNVIAGLEELTAGDVYFDDALMNYVPPHKREVAMVFQSYALYPQKTVFENIAFGLRLRKVPDAEVRAAGPGRRRAARDHAPARAPAVRAFRRPAPAGGARPGDRAQAVGIPDGRAAEQSRCRAARRHARADQAAASDHAHHVRVCDP